MEINNLCVLVHIVQARQSLNETIEKIKARRSLEDRLR